jgi:hypothetical protein
MKDMATFELDCRSALQGLDPTDIAKAIAILIRIGATLRMRNEYKA